MAKIIVAEDEAEIMTIYRIILESGGYQVLAASDGEACLETYKNELSNSRTGQVPVDLLVLDQRMPKMGGAMVAKEVLAMTPDQPVVIITAYRDHPELKDPALANIQILEKPIDPDWLLDFVSKIVDQNKGPRTLGRA